MKLGELIGSDAALAEDVAGISILGLSADSRSVQSGFLFAALPGVKTDGSKFIGEAAARGAAAILAPRGAGADDVGVPVIEVEEPRHTLALAASRFFGAQPETAVAVTGTNGKTSVASFVRQLWTRRGLNAASVGTIGVIAPKGTTILNHTTPDPIELHRILGELAGEGVTHLAIEASSHGLQQHRLDGLKLKAGGFTNITRDHLDYHHNFEDYLAQKLRLFRDLLAPGDTAVVDIGSEAAERVAAECIARGLNLISVGKRGKTLRLLEAVPDGFSQTLKVLYEGETREVRLPLVGDFQASNALVAAGLVMATTGAPLDDVLPMLSELEGAKGRLDLGGTTGAGAPIFIDYAHTPDALAKAIEALRPYVRHRLLVVFGCGGDRDRGKRPQMGAVATKLADQVYVTDDNPRSEEAADIRRAILSHAPGAIEIADRTEAIGEAISHLEEGDVLLVAGKGHETGQIVGNQIIPYSDHEAVAAALSASEGNARG
ncbi:UDP-N-acetylmuramoyl-L-alanyl-D-glutamate--2,6-diaminopimelate ligase [Methyloligella halotolerans]|uniref:UDP-N-acetylmuramoyl-L-alanyl-D-glutamate--2,6-diaminopimelate ligase n=1 Tax=Methyloligella halotolerans TaxID=1177755 RepID=A0A1E2S3K2_9HYPH|nr:UDP-N-acetylmuramoyl-L-alanyl-D-glutamate--2,6-diaminopimelate ligase [Methyloligella halotolerans]ODA69021.1 UDP-N-acetylmuramoyl-L-alanyl-D-glutamate--2,6-diaminopimelate ligase [Methyloligella halotolerans]